jgi:hypothetical protein
MSGFPRRRRKPRQRTQAKTAARGYGGEHQKRHAWWEPHVQTGCVPCHADICLEVRDGRSRLIAPGTPWTLGHTPDRSGWTGPEHRRCGAADGARRGNQRRGQLRAAAKAGVTASPAVTVTAPLRTSRQW